MYLFARYTVTFSKQYILKKGIFNETKKNYKQTNQQKKHKKVNKSKKKKIVV